MRKVFHSLFLCFAVLLMPMKAEAKSKNLTFEKMKARLEEVEKIENDRVKKEIAEAMPQIEEAKKSVLGLLTEAEEITLYSLKGGKPYYGDQKPKEAPENLRGYHLFGKTEVTGDEAKAAVGAFRQAIENTSDFVAACFNPHHAITFKAKNHIYDYILCYECMKIAIYEDGVYIALLPVNDDSSTLDKLLDAHNIERLKKEK